MYPTANEINLLSGQFTSPFLDCLFDFTDTSVSMTTLHAILQTMHRYGMSQEIFMLLQLLSDIFGYPFFIENAVLDFDDATIACFASEVLADMEEYVQDMPS